MIAARYASLLSFAQARGFCPTGDGGGIDNSCDGSGSSTSEKPTASKPKWMGDVDASGSAKNGAWFLEKNSKQAATPWRDGGDPATHVLSLVGDDEKVKAFVYADLSDDKQSLYMNYAEVAKPLRGQGVYKSLLDSLSEQFRVVSDEEHNVATAAKKAYESLGARLDRYGHYVLDKKKKHEDRAFCPNGEGNGVTNNCGSKEMSAPDKDSGGGSTTRPSRNPDTFPDTWDTDSSRVIREGLLPAGLEKLGSFRLGPNATPREVMRLSQDIGIKSPKQLVTIGACNVTDADVTVNQLSSNAITVRADIPAGEGTIFVDTIIRKGEDGPTIDYKLLDLDDAAREQAANDDGFKRRVAGQMYDVMLSSMEAAEKAGFVIAETVAEGHGSGNNSDDKTTFQGYRLWGRFGFDAKVPRRWFASVKDKGVDVHSALNPLDRDQLNNEGVIRLQQILATKQGEQIWKKWGIALGLTFDFTNRGGDGYLRYKKMLAASKRAPSKRDFFEYVAGLELREDPSLWSGFVESRGDAPAPEKDRIKGSDVNDEGSAKNKSGDISLDESTISSLKKKVEEHNAAMREAGKPDWTHVRLPSLKAVFRRGAGAFSTSHRPGMARDQWAMARVNAFLTLARRGRPENAKYTTDNDLLHSDHPKHSKESRGFCATGDGGGIDNSCGAKTMSAPDKDGGGGSAASSYKYFASESEALKSAVTRWKGDPTDLGIHVQDEIDGLPPPPSGSGTKLREMASALLKEVKQNSRPAPTLYRGDNKTTDDNSSALVGWSSNRRVAEKWADRYGGTLQTLEGASGVKLSDIVGKTMDTGEDEWIVLNARPATSGGGSSGGKPLPSYANDIEHSMPKSKGFDDPKNSLAWLNPSGTFFPVSGDHGWYAERNGVDGGGDTLLDAGWLRVAGHSGSTMYVGNPSGFAPRGRQLSALKDFAISTDRIKRIIFDNGKSRSGTVLWQSDESRSADCGREDDGKFASGNKCGGSVDMPKEDPRGRMRYGNGVQTDAARKLYQMGSSEKKLKSLVDAMGGDPKNTRVDINPPSLNISVADKNGNKLFHVDLQNGRARLYPAKDLTPAEAAKIKEAAGEAFSGRQSDHTIKVFSKAEDMKKWEAENAAKLKKWEDKYAFSTLLPPHQRPKKWERSIDAKHASLLAFAQSRGFCPNGEGNGVTNTCSSKQSSDASVVDVGELNITKTDYPEDDHIASQVAVAAKYADSIGVPDPKASFLAASASQGELDPKSWAAVNNYVGGGWLREDIASQLLPVISRSPLAENVTLMRGLRLYGDSLTKAVSSGEISHASIHSWSTDPRVAARFGAAPNPDTESSNVVLVLQNATHGLAVKRPGSKEDWGEAEFILPPSVLSVKKQVTAKSSSGSTVHFLYVAKQSRRSAGVISISSSSDNRFVGESHVATESRDCGQDPDGKFSKGNTCAGGIAADAAKGAATGAVFGAVSGFAKTFLPQSAATGAAAGAVAGAVKGIYDNQMRPTRVSARIEKVGMTDESVAGLVKGLGGTSKSLASTNGRSGLTLTIRAKGGRISHVVDITDKKVSIYPVAGRKEMTDDQIATIKKIASDNAAKETTVVVKTNSLSYASRLAKKGFVVAAKGAGVLSATAVTSAYLQAAPDVVLGITDLVLDTHFTDSFYRKPDAKR